MAITGDATDDVLTAAMYCYTEASSTCVLSGRELCVGRR